MTYVPKPRPNGECSVERAIVAIRGKWKMLVLRVLLLEERQRYNGLLAAIPGISAKELTRNLRELERDGLVVRNGNGHQYVEYALTPRGHKLFPAFVELGRVGEELLAG